MNNQQPNFVRRENVGSIAIWDRDDMDFSSIAKPYSPERYKWLIDNYAKLRKRIDIVVLGLNPSSDVNKYQNFHSVSNKDDRRLRFLFDKSSYRGAYMTDIFTVIKGSSSYVDKFIEDNAVYLNNQFQELYEELKAFKVFKNSNVLIILLGNKSEKYFNKFMNLINPNQEFPKCNIHTVKIYHCSLRLPTAVAYSNAIDLAYFLNEGSLLNCKTSRFIPQLKYNLDANFKNMKDALINNFLGEI